MTVTAGARRGTTSEVRAPARPATHAERDAMLRLASVDGLGPVTVRRLVHRFGSARAVLGAVADRLESTRGIGPARLAAIRAAARMDTGSAWARARELGGVALVERDPTYPALLRHVPDPPPILWARPGSHAGSALSDRMAVAVVGTRRCTPYGRRMARSIAADLAARGVVVVSGMAYGIDAEAHLGALEAGGTTVAVLGSGIGRIYPVAHRGLAARIANSGAIVSEFVPDARAEPGHFPRRNRIVAGMSRATVVVESHERGGALITARLALDYDREVFGVPGPVDSPASRGVLRLFAEPQARPIAMATDVADALWPHLVSEPRPKPVLEGAAATVYGQVTEQPLHVDAIADRTGLDVSTVLVSLLTLEMDGLVRQLTGRFFCRRTA